MSLQNLQFGYFNLQGRGQIARLLLAYTKTQYDEVTYTFAKISDWLEKDKQNLGLDFPSLPYLIDGKLKLTESKAIEVYIIHRANRSLQLLGKNSKQAALINNIDGVIREVLNFLIGLFFTSDFQAQRQRIYSPIQQKLNYLNQYIGRRNTFLNRITYVDFLMTVTFSYLRLYFPFQFQKWQNLKRVHDNINQLPEIVEYYHSSKAVSDLVAIQKAGDPRFYNIKPVKQIQQEDTSTYNSKQAQKENNKSEIKNKQQTEQIQSNNQNSQAKLVHQQTKLKKQQDAQQNRQLHHKNTHFHSKVQQYQKAAQATSKVQLSEIKVDFQKSAIITPSKIGSAVNSNGYLQASWKLLSDNKLNSEKQTKNPSITLGYWAIRGLGQIQRHLLTYCGHDFTQVVYKTRQQWLNADKISLNLPFPNLPYLILDDIRLTESLAIDRYIIRTSEKRELLGRNLVDETLIENIVKILSQIFKDLRVLCFATESIEQNKNKLEVRINNDFKRMNDFIQNKQFSFGYITWADFYISQISYYIQKIYPEIYQKYHFFKNIRNAVEKNKNVQKYYEDQNAIKGPFMPPTAKIFF